ncbi:MAG TPA: ATP-binding protein [Lacunisphaera sp.]|jgi:signal transduction histidine kinase/CheY-like chemotaxis protein/uncharacterized protein YdeI (BOF family)|nr:ATP-binding protein [Lacunisphaera sp.]
MSPGEAARRHRLRLEFLVFYYDPLWGVMWGRAGDEDSYLSIGTHPFPITSGQLILVEGYIRASGLTVEEPKVTLLKESMPLEPVDTKGAVNDSSRLTKRYVSMEGVVDQQRPRDANHLELDLIAEGYPVSVQLLVKSAEDIPPLTGTTVRARGVYFARPEGTGSPRIELWVQDIRDIEITGQLATEQAFLRPFTKIRDLAKLASATEVRIAGQTQRQDPGRSLTVADETGAITVPTAQRFPMAPGSPVEVIAETVRSGDQIGLAKALYRPALDSISTLPELLNAPDTRKNRMHRVEARFTVYYYDPEWRVMWGRWDDTDTFLGLDNFSAELKPGQKVLIRGTAIPGQGLMIHGPAITVQGEEPTTHYADTRGRVAQTETFDRHPVKVEGYIDRQVASDSHHLELSLIAEGRLVTVWVLNRAGLPANLQDKLIEARGVYSATIDPMGGPPKIELWVPDLSGIETKGDLGSDARFNRSATPVEDLAKVAPDQLVRIEGIVRLQQPGRSLIVRDSTGQVRVLTVQNQPLPLGARVEAIGYARREGEDWVLHTALYRPARGPAPVPGPAGHTVLRLAEQVRELSPDEAAQGQPVQLSGIITWASREADFFFMNDTSGGVCVVQPPQRSDKVMIGVKVTVTGVSAPGKFTPLVLANELNPTARLDLPEPKQITLEQALTGIEDAQWISLRGYVRDVQHDGAWGRLAITTSAGEFTGLLTWSNSLAGLRGSVVRVNGVCSVLTNAKRQLTGIQVWIPSLQHVAIEEPAPADPFAIPERSLASLRQYNSGPALNRLVRVAGTVVHQVAGEVLHIQDGTEGLMVLSHQPTTLMPGDRVEVVGLPGWEGSRVVLREAVFRRLASGPQPVPVNIARVEPVNVELDGRLASIEARLLDPGARGRSDRLVLQANGVIFEGLLDRRSFGADEAWAAGSEVRLTGLYSVDFDEYKRPHAVRFLLRSPADVVVLRRPPWLTLGRAFSAIGILLAGWVLGFAWVVALRRRVFRQTAQIREQLENEKAARLEAALVRASKLESLGVLAGGIAHDFNNLLTVVMGNLSLAKMDQRMEAETRECLQQSEQAALRARELTQQLITFAKGGEPVRTVTDLTGVVREAALFALHGAKARCEFEFSPGVWAADVDRGQIGQVVQNLVLNATHAMPLGGVIRLALTNEQLETGAKPALATGRYVRLSIADQGSGIAPEHLPRIFEPYFTTKAKGSGLGLATVYSIIKRHDGHVEVQSKPREGTRFDIWLPAANGQASEEETRTAPVTVKEARVLFMDDETSIRTLAGSIFKRMGIDFTAVADGDAALREYRSARAAGRPYSLVMLDLTVPGAMGGAEAMEKLRQIDPDVRAVVSSGYSNDPVMANYRAHGFRARVTKPYDIGEFTGTLNRLLTGSNPPTPASGA